MSDPATVTWQLEASIESYNVYHGDLEVRRASGIYSQDPAVVSLAAGECDLVGFSWNDPIIPEHGRSVFCAVTGNAGGV